MADEADADAAGEIVKMLRLSLSGDELAWLTARLGKHRMFGVAEGINTMEAALNDAIDNRVNP